MTTKYTLQNALAYVAITKSERELTHTTRNAISEFVENQADNGQFKVKPEGEELAERSRLMKAHKRMVAQGYEPDLKQRFRPNKIPYVKGRARGYITGTGLAYQNSRQKKIFQNG